MPAPSSPEVASPSQSQADTSPPLHVVGASFANGSLQLDSGSQSDAPARSIWDDSELSPKVRHACAIARANGFRYLWIDSCCIDKASSSELSEAINSMYAWYARAIVCYAYLADVPAGEDHGAPRSRFRKSRWFTRGWTFQELLAPRHVEFVAQDWTAIGSKHTLVSLVEGITGIDERALLHLTPLDKFSVSQRLSWASKRQTTRVEDEAYSLLGIFDINMPTLYGEGERAFRRLQEEIMRRIPDQSLFAWGDVLLTSSETPPEGTPAATNPTPPHVICYTNSSESHSLLATRSSIFGAHSGTIRAAPVGTLPSIRDHVRASRYRQIEYTPTPYGIRTQFQLIPLSQYMSPGDSDCIQYVDDEMRSWQWYLAILGCEHQDYPGHLLGKVCYIPPSASSAGSGVDFLYSGCISTGSVHSGFQYPHLLPLSPGTLARCRKHIELKTVYIPHCPANPAAAAPLDIGIMPYKALRFVLLRETRDALARRGYTATLRGPDQDQDQDRETAHGHRLELSGRQHTLAVEFQHALRCDGRAFTVAAHASIVCTPSLSAETDLGLDDGDLTQAHAQGFADARGPRQTATVYWSDESSGFLDWKAHLGPARMELCDGSGRAADSESVVLVVGLDFAGMGFYLLRVDVHGPQAPSSPDAELYEAKRPSRPPESGTAREARGRTRKDSLKGGQARLFRERMHDRGCLIV
ncbi:hypothetical protein GSI_09236 [Ganoderma sinense ZZ0214-1]|uniref:Uncharacterized protein n=1 Tax=Ganoderma sinense ZZ0214-1 TaxID=1077348 RepID=A0A2G8S621_9APHY|nr:hypothetical protein GSI_09236 [Ganoderma sinense ZZ0214-1]